MKPMAAPLRARSRRSRVLDRTFSSALGGRITRVSAALAAIALLAGPAFAEEPAPPPAESARPVLLDRVVVRWHAPETGGAPRPQFIFQRELAFEARLEALADPDPEPGPYRDRHVRAALDRHIAETLLASLAITPEPLPKDIAGRAEAARAILEQRVRGRDRLIDAASKEGMSSDELDALLRRQARASLYLDRMVAPLLQPSLAELRDLFRSGATPFKDRPFDQVSQALSRWYVGQRLAQAVEAYYLNARARVVIAVVKK
jgi:hypothetical protein